MAMTKKGPFRPKAFIPAIPIVARKWMLHVISSVPKIKPNVAGILRSHFSRYTDNQNIQRQSPVVSGIAIATTVGLGPQLAGSIFKESSKLTFVQPDENAGQKISLVLPQLDDIDYDSVDVSQPSTVSTGSMRSWYLENLNTVDDSASDTDNSLSTPSVPSSTANVQDSKSIYATEPSSAPFAYAGFGPSVLEQIDYGSLEDTIRAVNIHQPSVVESQSIAFSPQLSDSFEFVLVEEYPASEGEVGYEADPMSAADNIVNASHSSYGSAYDFSTDAPCGGYTFEEEDEPEVIENVPTVLFDGVYTYVVHGRIGNGAFGRVVLATNQYGEAVAVKIMHKAKIFQYYGGRDMTINEHRILEKITFSGKPFLTTMVSSWQDEKNIYFVMRLYFDSLDRVLNKICIRNEPNMLKQYATELVIALKNLQDLNIMHCDIKPANILVGHDGHLALGDFGLSYVPSKSKHKVQYCKRWDVVGTPEYMAPEVVTCTGATGYMNTADVWSLGLVLYEMASDLIQPYFTSANETDRRHRILSEVMDFTAVDAVDEDLGDLLRKMLERNPKKRLRINELSLHPYFHDIDFEQFQERPPTPIHRPGFPHFDTNTDISFDSYHMGLDRDFPYSKFWKDDELIMGPAVAHQLEQDRADPECYNFICPPELRYFALCGWPKLALPAEITESTSSGTPAAAVDDDDDDYF